MFSQQSFGSHAAARWSVCCVLGFAADSAVSATTQVPVIRDSGLITASDGENGNLFGWDLAVNDQYLLVGAPGRDEYSGGVYVYDTQTRQELRRIGPLVDDQSGWFGGSVDLADNLALIFGVDNNSSASTYHLYDVSSGDRLSSLISDDQNQLDFRFNSSGGYAPRAVALNDRFALVEGGYLVLDDSPSGGSTRSATYLFDITDPSQPRQAAQLPAGRGRALDGDRALITRAFDANDRFSAALYDLSNPDKPALVSRLTPNDPASIEQYGRHYLDLDGDLAVIFGTDDKFRGFLSVFDVSEPANAYEAARIYAPATDDSDVLGNWIGNFDLDGNQLLVGNVLVKAVNGENRRFSSAFLYDLSDLANIQATVQLVSDQISAYNVNLTGNTAYLPYDGDSDFTGGVLGIGRVSVFKIPEPSGLMLVTAVGVGCVSRTRRPVELKA